MVRRSRLRWTSACTTLVLTAAAILTPVTLLRGPGLIALAVLIVGSQLVFWLAFPWSTRSSRRRYGHTALSVIAWVLSTPGVLAFALLARVFLGMFGF